MDFAVLMPAKVIIFIYSGIMYKKKCKLCGNDFIAKHNNTKYCSDTCRRIASNQQKRNWRQKHPEYYNEACNVLTDDFIHQLSTGAYTIESIPSYWRTREQETPGYVLSVAELYHNCNFLCEVSGRNGSVIHHLNSYHWDVDGRCDKNNMIVINRAIHNFFHFLYGYRNNTIEQFDEFLNIHFCTSISTILQNRGCYMCN